jgi:DGQHR domain-containing protein
MICSCCGYEITEKQHQIEGGTKYVCDRCWNNPDLFFPEKLQRDERLRLLSEIAKEVRNQPEVSCVQAIRLYQKGIEMYIGKMKAKEILRLFEIDKFEEEELTGYQREAYKERTSELVEYLDGCPVAVMPGLLVSLRESRFVSKEGDIGILEIPNRRGSLWIIDGQHRLGGFGRIRDKFLFERKSNVSPSFYLSLMNYELPVVFIDVRKATEKVSSGKKRKKLDIKPEDLERAVFFIVNKTQKGINPSLKDALLYRIKMGGIEGIPALEKESWRIHAAFIGIMLNRDIESPLKDRINISGKREQGKPIRLNSFVSSLEKLFRDKDFSDLNDEERLRFIKIYWTALREMLPEAFNLKTSKEYMVLKALGLHSLHWIAYDVLKKCIKRGLRYDEEETLKKILNPLESFDWTTQTSPLSTLGGMKGVNEAHRLLLKALNYDTEEKSSSTQRLEQFLASIQK